jgi:hypothetical protein
MQFRNNIKEGRGMILEVAMDDDDDFLRNPVFRMTLSTATLLKDFHLPLLLSPMSWLATPCMGPAVPGTT